MKNDFYYFRYAISFAATFLAVTLLLGSFYPFLKSFFFANGDPVQAFLMGVKATDWLRHSLVSIFIGIVLALNKRRKARKAVSTEQ